jgi:chromosomal replication initiator protein
MRNALAADGMMPQGLEDKGVDVPVTECWQRVQTQFREEFGEATYNSWLRMVDVVTLDDACVQLAAPTRFMRDWVTTNYGDRLRDLWRLQIPGIETVEIHVHAKGSPAKGAATPAFEKPGAALPARAQDEDDFGAPLDKRFTFESFVMGRSNEFAHAAARQVAESAAVKFNPLFLYGGVGLGKTHLMHAIAWHIRERDPSRKVVYMSAEMFMYRFIRALRYKDTMEFKQQFRSVDVLMIDDVQFIAHKNSTQEEFFHTFNALVDHHRQVIISADRSPSNLEGIEERIRTRLGWGLVADIHPTDYELRLGILQAKAEAAGSVAVPSEVMEFLARRITSNVRELEGALNRVLAYATLVGRPISIEMTQEVLQDLLRANDRRVSIEDIQRQVSDYFNIRLSDLLSARRARAVARPRQVAMYLAKQLTTRSLPEIGRKFGGRDHTTVMHAVKRIEELRSADSALSEDISHLRRSLES